MIVAVIGDDVALVAANEGILFAPLAARPNAVLLFVQALPARIRAGATGIVYALAIAIFGGTTQLFETLLLRWTGNPVAPGWYMMGAVIVALNGALLIPEPPRKERGGPGRLA